MLDIGGEEPNGVVEVTSVGLRDPLLGSIYLIEPLHVAQISGVWLQPGGPTLPIIQNLFPWEVPGRTVGILAGGPPTPHTHRRPSCLGTGWGELAALEVASSFSLTNTNRPLPIA